MKEIVRQKIVVFVYIWVAMLLLPTPFSFSANPINSDKFQSGSTTLKELSRTPGLLDESLKDYFSRYMNCYRENFLSSDFIRDMAACMNPVSEGGLSTFSDYEELEVYLKNQYSTRVRSYGDLELDVAVDVLLPTDLPAPEPKNGLEADTDSSESPGSSDSSGNGFSGTNIQELGVDESDKVKTDGNFFYVAAAQEVNIVAIDPALEIVSTISLEKLGNVNSLYLYEEILVVLYDSYSSFPKPVMEEDYGWYYNNMGVAFYDVSNQAEAVLLKTVELEGSLVSSRRIGNKLHVVQQFSPIMPPIRYYYEPGLETKDDVVEENKERVEEVSLEKLIPYYSVIYPKSKDAEILPVVAPENFYKPVDENGGGQIATVVTFDLDRLDDSFDAIAMIANARSVYASTRALFVFSDRWNDGAPADSPSRQQTEIYKFDLTGDSVTAVASGRVNGTILNQFSLGEDEDVLRVATNTRIWTKDQSEIFNHIYCLRENGTSLDVIGKIENLAFGEQIYAARFIGKRGFLVTFVNVDPLFTLDLSDPTAPKVAGELKVPGYSDYIHPWGENHLITIGKDAISDGRTTWTQGVQLSIFDVTQFDNPSLLHKLIIGDRGTQSEANYNHKAFTFWTEHDLLAIPIDLYKVTDRTLDSSPSTYGNYVSSDLYVFSISQESGFEQIGTLPVQISKPNQFVYNPWTRGVFVEENIYSVTESVMHSAVIDNIDGTTLDLTLPSDRDASRPPIIIEPLPGPDVEPAILEEPIEKGF